MSIIQRFRHSYPQFNVVMFIDHMTGLPHVPIILSAGDQSLHDESQQEHRVVHDNVHIIHCGWHGMKSWMKRANPGTLGVIVKELHTQTQETSLQRTLSTTLRFIALYIPEQASSSSPRQALWQPLPTCTALLQGPSPIEKKLLQRFIPTTVMRPPL